MQHNGPSNGHHDGHGVNGAKPALTHRGRIVIVGASLAGLSAAETLRAEGFTGSLTVIGDEPYLPYDRPPPSKDVLAGWFAAEHTQLPRGATLAGVSVAAGRARARAWIWQPSTSTWPMGSVSPTTASSSPPAHAPAPGRVRPRRSWMASSPCAGGTTPIACAST